MAALHRPPDAQRRRKRQHQAEEDRRAGHTEGRLRGTRPGAGAQLYQLAIGQIEGFCPAAAKLLEEAEADALAYLDFPYEHPVRLRTNNVQERANRELKRRSRVVQVFPSRKSLIRMMGAVFSEMDEDWVARRWFNDDSIGRAVEGAEVNAPAHAYEGTAAEHAARIIALVVADNPIPGRKEA